MSDFDEEAERERLREKYEREEQKREATEQMSELLLKGATMTNAHCSDCGDPIFRYDGQEFCPTCEKPVDRGGDEASGEDGDADETGPGEDRVEVTSPSDDARVKFGGDADEATDEAAAGEPKAREPVDSSAADESADEAAADASAPSRTPETEPTRDPADSPRIAEGPSSGQESSRRQAAHHRTGDRPTGSAGKTSDVASNVATARASLARTAARFASAAENTDDPAVAREHLAAAREAAEALDELD